MKTLKRICAVALYIVMCISAPGVFSVKSEASGEADSYTVLVLEDSGFLSTIGRQQVQSSAKWICSALLGANGTNKIAIVKYNRTNTSIPFTDSYNILNNEINSMTFSDFPNITSALESANSLLKNVPSSSKRNIILISCGMPWSDPEVDDGPYTDKNMCDSHTCCFNEEANSVYNLAETYKPYYNIYSIYCKPSSIYDIIAPWVCAEGRIRLLTDISNGGFYNANCDNLALMLMKLTDCVTERTPKGYNFLEDSYKFINDQTPNLSKKYFTTIFESGTADLMYKKHHKTGGLCYGMASTTAAIYNGLPDVSKFSYLDGWTPKQAAKIRDLSRSSDLGSKVVVGGNYDDFLELSDYIKYAYIYQFSTEQADIIHTASRNPFDTLNLVKQYTDSNRIGVLITFRGLKEPLHNNIAGNHTVLAIGYDGNDILIDDSNYRKDYGRITIHSDGSWEYGDYNSDDHALTQNTLTHRPYQILLTGNKIVGSDWFEGSGSAEHYVEGVERLDADYTLVSIDAETFNIDSSDYVEISDISGEAETSDESNARLFWIKDSKTIKIDGLTDDVNIIEYGGDDTVISAVVSADSTVELTIDGDTKTAAVNTEKDEINTLTFSVVDDDGNKKGVEVSGTASGDLVTAKKTETGITVDGLNDMTITYLKDEEEVSDKKAEVKDGRKVNITVDDNEETVDTDFVPDSAKCKYCGKVHGNSFIEILIKLIHKLFYFISKLFK